MAETWQVILWVIAAAILVIIISVVIASLYAWRKRSRRKKNKRRRSTEWGKNDETDYSKKKVQYSARSGEVKILDEPDSGTGASREKKVQFDAKTGEARILGVFDSEARAVGHDEWKESEVGSRKEENSGSLDIGAPSFERNETKQSGFTLEERYQSNRTEVGYDKRSSTEIGTEVSRWKDRERLQPLEVSPPTRNVQADSPRWNERERLQPLEVVPTQWSSHSVKSYTNLGYSDAKNENDRYPSPAVQFQQPVAVVRAIVHPGSTREYGKAKSLPRNFSKLNYKKSSFTSTTPRRKPAATHTWSLEAQNTHAPQSWVNIPIRICDTHHPIRRRKMLRHAYSTDSALVTSRERNEHARERAGLTRWGCNRSVPHRRSSRSLKRHSSRRRKQNQTTTSLYAPSFNGVYIRDSLPPPAYERSPVRTNDYELSPEFEERYHEPSSHQNRRKPSPVPKVSAAEREGTDYYKENYKMVRRSEFPGKSFAGGGHFELEPDIASIVSGSEFSDFMLGPPRPSDSQSSEVEHTGRYGEEVDQESHEKSFSKCTYGSYKEYSKSLSDEDKRLRDRARTVREKNMSEDKTRHVATFQDTLEDLKNGHGKRTSPVRQDETKMVEPVQSSPWVNNDTSFRKTHGIPITGVPVLPPEPVFIQMDTDSSN